jgi:hypothetical protein
LSSGSYWIGIDKRPPILSGDLGLMLGSEINRFQRYFGDDRWPELTALALTLVGATGRALWRRYPDPLVLGLTAAFGLFVTIVSGKSEFYVVLFFPWLVLLLAGLVSWLGGLVPRARWLVGVAAVAATPFVFNVQDNYDDLVTARGNFPTRGYYALIEELRPHIPPGASIIGPPLFWLGFNDHPYTDYYVWERLRAERRERFSSYAARLKPDLAVLDAKSRHQISINSPGYLENTGVLLKSVRHVGFDRVEVWKLS